MGLASPFRRVFQNPTGTIGAAARAMLAFLYSGIPLAPPIAAQPRLLFAPSRVDTAPLLVSSLDTGPHVPSGLDTAPLGLSSSDTVPHVPSRTDTAPSVVSSD
jgi:hypothetical protein